MFLNSLAAWSAVLKGTQPKPEKSSSAFTTFWFAFAVAELAPISVNFLYRWAASTYSLCCEVSLRQLISFSPLCAILRSLPHAVHNAGTSHFREFWMRIFTPRIVEFTQYFLFFDGAGCELSTIYFEFFSMLSIIIGNNRKIGPKWKQFCCGLRGMDIEHKIWKP